MSFSRLSDQSEKDIAILPPEDLNYKEKYGCNCCCHEEEIYQRRYLPPSRCLSLNPHVLVEIIMAIIILILLILVMKSLHSQSSPNMILGAQEGILPICQ